LSRKKDSRGRPRKKEFGAGTTAMLKLLASMRGLRGTPFDVFRFSHDRRTERALIVEFESLVDEAVASLNDTNKAQFRDAVAAWMDVRGYGPVKDEAVEDVRRRVSRTRNQIVQ
jgi:indolepyruvate ferredoxin oxidoreductase